MGLGIFITQGQGQGGGDGIQITGMDFTDLENVVITGFGFGDNPGTLTEGRNNRLTVKDWSDTSITVDLTSLFDGEWHMVWVTNELGDSSNPYWFIMRWTFDLLRQYHTFDSARSQSYATFAR